MRLRARTSTTRCEIKCTLSSTKTQPPCLCFPAVCPSVLSLSSGTCPPPRYGEIEGGTEGGKGGERTCAGPLNKFRGNLHFIRGRKSHDGASERVNQERYITGAVTVPNEPFRAHSLPPAWLSPAAHFRTPRPSYSLPPLVMRWLSTGNALGPRYGSYPSK